MNNSFCKNNNSPNKKTVVVLAMGGTIAGRGECGRETGYTPGTEDITDVLRSVGGIDKAVNVLCETVTSKNSDDITDEDMISLVGRINFLAKNDNISGFVVTHGTDTLEETSYFLNLTVKTEKCVVVTGSMRPMTSLSADGPMNLYQSIVVAADEKSVGRGVLCVFAGRIIPARNVRKSSSYSLAAIDSNEMGACGIVRDEEVFFYTKTDRRHTVNSNLSVDETKKLPRVDIVYFSADDSTDLLEKSLERADGVVIAGAGAGEFSEKYHACILRMKADESSKPIVITTRTGDGVVTRKNLLCENTIAGDNLNPQKARVLLRLAMLQRKNETPLPQSVDFQDEIQKYFDEY